MSTRREFIQTAGTAAAGAALAPSSVLGANDRVRLGVIGSGNRATHVMNLFLKEPHVEVVALCDVWDEAIAKAR